MSPCGTGSLQLNLLLLDLLRFILATSPQRWPIFVALPSLIPGDQVTQPLRLAELCCCDCRDLSGSAARVTFLTSATWCDESSIGSDAAGLRGARETGTCPHAYIPCVLVQQPRRYLATYAPLPVLFLRLGAQLSQLRPVSSTLPKTDFFFLIE